ncbi:RDD family protein [Pseudomonadota bacterium]
MNNDKNETTLLYEKGVKFSGFWRRFAALIIDYLIIIFFVLTLGNVLNSLGFTLIEKDEIITIMENGYINKNIETTTKEDSKSPDENQETLDKPSEKIIQNRNILNILLIVAEALYFTFFIASKKQSTIGQRIFKIMVVSRCKGEMTILHSFIRYIFMNISIQFFGIGFITIPFSKEKATLYDLICNTRLVHSSISEEAKETVTKKGVAIKEETNIKPKTKSIKTKKKSTAKPKRKTTSKKIISKTKAKPKSTVKKENKKSK